jgi:hypothetical protein
MGRGEAGNGAGTVGAMEGAIEPPRMGLRRVPAPFPASLQLRNCFSPRNKKSPGNHRGNMLRGFRVQRGSGGEAPALNTPL